MSMMRSPKWLLFGLLGACGVPDSGVDPQVEQSNAALAQYSTYDPASAANYATNNYNRAYGAAAGQNPYPSFPVVYIRVAGKQVATQGNCTNFVSQALVGGMIRSNDAASVWARRGDFAVDKGSPYPWYLLSANDRAPAWTSPDWLYKYAKGNTATYKGLHFTYVTNDTLTTFMDYNKVQKGDVIFADWDHNGSMDHAMLVTDIAYWTQVGYDKIRVTYQSNDRTNIGLGWINDQNGKQGLFYVYRPVDYNPNGK